MAVLDDQGPHAGREPAGSPPAGGNGPSARRAETVTALTRLAGGVAHDLNNLLTIVNGYSDILLQDLAPGDPSRPHAAEIFQAGERAAELTRQLLAFSGRQVLTPRVLDLNRVVADAEARLRSLLPVGVHLGTDLAPGLWPVRADAGQVVQALTNLVTTARDALPAGGTLTIATRNVGPGEFVRLSVADTGPGLAPDLLPHAFEPYFLPGVGLALATVAGFARQCGGHAEASSEPGHGTKFAFDLPRDLPPPAGVV